MLHLYKPLTSNDPTIRLKAASDLTSQLLALVGSDPTAPDSNSTLDVGKEDTTPPEASNSTPTSLRTAPPPRATRHAKEEIHYALTRLIRGLASGVESARPGFAVVLTEYLSTLLLPGNQVKWSVSVELVLGLVHKHMEITEHLSRLEERDRWLGRLFGLKAIIMSGCLFQHTPLDREGGVSKEREFRTVMGEMLDLSREKSWLREPGMWTVVSAARRFGWDRVGVGLVWRMVVERDLAKTSEGVGVWLCFEEMCPGATGEVQEGRVWGEGKWGPLMGGNLQVLARVLKESGAAGLSGGEKESTGAGGAEQGKGKKGGKGSGVGGKGVWNPKLHWVWDEIIRVYLSQEAPTPSTSPTTEDKEKSSKKDIKNPTPLLTSLAPFPQFFLIIVDESLFSATSSEERKFHGFLLLIKLLILLTASPEYIPTILPHLFTRNLLRCIINHLSDPTRYLHKSAAKAISALQTLAGEQASTVPIIVRGLVLGNGTTAFDYLSRTRTVERLLPMALAGGSGSAVREVVRVFREIIVTPPLTKTRSKAEAEEEDEDSGGDHDEEKENNKSAKREEETKRQWAADQLLSLVRSGKNKKQDSWTALVVELFAVLGHFDVTQLTGGTKSIIPLVLGAKIPTPKVSDASRSMFRARLSSVLGHLLSLKVSEVGDAVGAGVDRDTWPFRAVRVIREVMAEGGVLTMEFDEGIEKAVGRGWGRLGSIRAKRAKLAVGMAGKKEGGREISQLQAFELLYSLVLLQTYNGDSDAVELLEELEVCFGKIVKDIPTLPAQVKSKVGPVEGEDTMDASAILVGLLLSFLAKPSVLLRKIAGTVWSSFVGTEAVGNSALDALLQVLETKESIVGQQALFEREGEEDGDDDDDDVEMDSDVEVIELEEDGDEAGDTMDIDEEYKGVKPPFSINDAEELEDNDNDSDMATPSFSGSSDVETDLPTDDETSKFEAALGAALKTKKILPGQKDEVESDSDADMTDSEMMGLDKHLSVIFRERIKKLRAPISRKQDRKEARENVVVFKGKVVELLEGYVKGRFAGGSKEEVRGDGGLFLTRVVPRLLGVIRITGKPQLRERVAGVLRLFVRESGKGGNRTLGGTEPVSIDSLWQTLHSIHEEVLREGGGAGHTNACSMGSIAVVKALLKAEGENETGKEAVERITRVYARTMSKWLVSGGVGGCQGGSTAQIGSFFTDFVGWGGSVRKVGGVKEKSEVVKGESDEKGKEGKEGKKGGVVGEKKGKEKKKKEEKKEKEKSATPKKQKKDKPDKPTKEKQEKVKEGDAKTEKKQGNEAKAEDIRPEKKDKKEKNHKTEEVKPKEVKSEKKHKKEKDGGRDKKKETKEKKDGKRDLIVTGVAGEQSKKTKKKA